jgi:hypothetical protein
MVAYILIKYEGKHSEKNGQQNVNAKVLKIEEK